MKYWEIIADNLSKADWDTLFDNTSGLENMATIAKQQKQIEALTAGLQKVSDQLAGASLSRRTEGRIRSGRPAPQVVNNP
jgi:hypothetical protein